MVTVPIYNMRQVQVRPELQQGVDVRATPGAFGAAIGQGMQAVGQGLGQAADAFGQLRDFKDRLSAKDAQTARDREILDLQYGENGYLTTQGADAANGYDGYVAKVEEINKKYSATLSGGAARLYDDAVQSATTGDMRTGIVHSAQGTKDWAVASSTAALGNLKDAALASYKNPGEVDKLIARGLLEIEEQAGLMGLGGDKDVLELNRRAFATDVYKSVALAMAGETGGATKALEYLASKTDMIDTATRMDLEATLTPYANDEAAMAVVDEILGMGRASDEAAEGTVGAGGPTRVRAALEARSVGGATRSDAISGLNAAFATNIVAMFEDAPPGIREGLGLTSAYRSEEVQAGIITKNMAKYGFSADDKAAWNADVAAMGPAAAGEKWRPRFKSVGLTKFVGMPGGSNHQHGNAVDLAWNGGEFENAPQEVKDWVHANAAAYGMRFPMGHEPWHIEPSGARGGGAGATVVPARDGVSARAGMASYDAAVARVNEIEDPAVRAAAMKQLNAQFEMRGKAESAAAAAAKSEMWSLVAQGTPMSSIPLELKIAAGREAVQGFMDYESKAGEITTDPILNAKLTLFAATDPLEFARLDLTAPELINGLSKSDLKSLIDKQASVLTDERKAQEEGTVFKSAYSVAEEFYDVAGIITGTSQLAQSEENRRLEAQFKQSMMLETQQWMAANEGKKPGYEDLRAMAAGLILTGRVQEKRGAIGSFFDGDGMADVWEGKVFQRLDAPGGSEIKIEATFEQVPADWVAAISISLTQRGEEPTKDAIAAEWAKIATELVGIN